MNGEQEALGLTHYEVLGIQNTKHLTQQDLKTAYHKALLRHHPDKASSRTANLNRLSLTPSSQTISMDKLSLAYQTLSDAKAKIEYDRLLNNDRDAFGTEKTHYAGVDVVDLEDMTFEEQHGLWRRNCRCGDKSAYEVTEVELEREQIHGEIYVGCKGCSLFIKVIFDAVVDDNTNDTENR